MSRQLLGRELTTIKLLLESFNTISRMEGGIPSCDASEVDLESYLSQKECK